jgi:O-antigen ligase
MREATLRLLTRALFPLLPLATASALWLPEEAPVYMHPLTYAATALWGLIIVAALSRIWRTGLPLTGVAWSIPMLAVVLALNAIVLGNEYGQAKVTMWLATGLPLLLAPSMLGASAATVRTVAWGHIIAVAVVMPTVATLDRLFYGPGSFLTVALHAGAGALAAMIMLLRRDLRPAATIVRWVLVGVAIVSVLGLLLSGARATILTATVLLLAVGLLHPVRAIGAAVGGVALLLALDSISGFWEPIGAAVEERFAEQAVTVSIGARLIAYREAVDLIIRSPWVGVGSGGFADIHLMYRVGLRYPHNLLLELAAEFGMVALVALAGIVVAAGFGLRRLWRAGERGTVLIAAVLILYTFAHAMKAGDLNGQRLLFMWLGVATGVEGVRLSRRALTPQVNPEPIPENEASYGAGEGARIQ